MVLVELLRWLLEAIEIEHESGITFRTLFLPRNSAVLAGEEISIMLAHLGRTRLAGLSYNFNFWSIGRCHAELRHGGGFNKWLRRVSHH